MELTAEQQHKRMLEESLPKLLLSLSLPAVATQLISVVYNTADTWFVSQISTSSAAAVGVCFALMSIIQACGYGFSMGASSLISMCLGAKLDDRASLYATSATFGAMALGLLISILGLIYLEPIMIAFGSTETILPYSLEYAKYILYFAPIMCGTFVISNALRACGQIDYSMIGTVTGVILNIILDPILIFVLDMGVAGAAIATSISQTVSFIVLLYPFVKNKTIINISYKNISRKLSVYKTILTTGFPTICRQGFGSISTILLNSSAAIYGDSAVATITIVNKIYMFVRNVVLGVGQGFQPIAGYNYGAGNKKRTKEIFVLSCFYGTIICVASAILIFIFRYNIILWFRNDIEVITIGKEAIKYICIVMPFMAFSTFVNQLFQCLGFKVKAAILASCRQGICFIPLVFILPKLYGLKGVEMLQPGADLLTFIISIPFIIWFYKNIFNRDTLKQ